MYPRVGITIRKDTDNIEGVIKKLKEKDGSIIQSSASDLKGFKSMHAELIFRVPKDVNLCDNLKDYTSDKKMIDLLKMAREEGCNKLVLMLGKKKDNMSDNIAYYNVIERLKRIKLLKDMHIFLKNSPGLDNEIGYDLKDLAFVHSKVNNENIGICIDTCHLCVTKPIPKDIKGVRKWFGDFDRMIGLTNLKLINLNDSKHECGSKKDHHVPLLKGKAFSKESLEEWIGLAAERHIPIVLETSNNYDTLLQDCEKVTTIWKDRKPDSNEKVIGMLREVSMKMNNAGINRYKKAAYNKAAKALSQLQFTIVSGNELKDISGVGQSMMSHVDEILETGNLEKLKTMTVNKVSTYNANKFDITKIPGIGEETAKKLNISSEEDLKENLDKLTKSQRIYVKYIEDLQKTIPRKEAQDWEKTFKYPKIKTHLVGSYRRGKEQMGDLDLIIVSSLPAKMKKLIQKWKKRKWWVETVNEGSKKLTVLVRLEKTSPVRQLDIRLVKPSELPFSLLYFTGSATFNVKMRTAAKKMGYRLNEYGLFKGKKKVKNLKSEKDIFKKLNMKYVDPKDRI